MPTFTEKVACTERVYNVVEPFTTVAVPLPDTVCVTRLCVSDKKLSCVTVYITVYPSGVVSVHERRVSGSVMQLSAAPVVQKMDEKRMKNATKILIGFRVFIKVVLLVCVYSLNV